MIDTLQWGRNIWTKSIPDNLAEDDVKNNLKIADNPIKLLEQWRDWHWNEHLKDPRAKKGIILSNTHRNKAHALNEAIEILSELPLVPPVSESPYKYGEWPEND